MAGQLSLVAIEKKSFPLPKVTTCSILWFCDLAVGSCDCDQTNNAVYFHLNGPYMFYKSPL